MNSNKIIHFKAVQQFYFNGNVRAKPSIWRMTFEPLFLYTANYFFPCHLFWEGLHNHQFSVDFVCYSVPLPTISHLLCTIPYGSDVFRRKSCKFTLYFKIGLANLCPCKGKVSTDKVTLLACLNYPRKCKRTTKSETNYTIFLKTAKHVVGLVSINFLCGRRIALAT